jgi:PleD family two-component response regulator
MIETIVLSTMTYLSPVSFNVFCDVLFMVERQDPRFAVHLPLTFSGDQSGIGTVLNLSLGGCLAESWVTSVQSGDSLALSILLSPEQPALIVRTATAVWAAEHKFGTSFTRMLPTERDRFERYLQTLHVPVSKRILIALDDAHLVTLLTGRLQPFGCMVKEARDGMVMLQEAHRFKPHLIIVDIGIPGAGGVSILERLKLSADTQTIPIIVLTAATDSNLVARALAFGIANCLQKPRGIEGIEVCIDEVKRILSLSI